jgi:tetratricopeptide (TPR) repeat protein
MGTADLNSQQRRKLANLLYQSGETKNAKTMLDAIADVDQGFGYIWSSEEKIISELQGEEQLEKILARRAFDKIEAPSDHILGARDLVSKFGDKRALRIIFDTSTNPDADVGNRLEAIEVLDELGYRALSRSLIHQVMDAPDVDDWWIGDQLLRFGNKVEALERFKRSIKTCPKNYRDQIARRLAELQAVEALEMLEKSSPP